MKTPRYAGALIALCMVALMPALAALSQSSPPSKNEIAATAAWFDSLEWPDLRGKPYVEIMLGKSVSGSKVEDGPKMRGFLLKEDDAFSTIFSDGTVAKQSGSSSVGWPFAIQQIPKSPPGTDVNWKNTTRVIELETAVKEVLAELHRPKDKDEERRSQFGRKSSDRTALFVLARCCARQGRFDLAGQLDKEMITLHAGFWSGSGSEKVTFRIGIEKEIAHALMWKAVDDFGDARVARPELLVRFERIAREFPNSEHHGRAAGFVAMLRTMIAEDEAHARTAKAPEAMSGIEKIQDLIFLLRDQNGHQWSQPGSCDIFGDFGQPNTENSPAHQLVKLGHSAVPALIEALGDKRLSRSVGYHRNFYFSHFVLTVGDCAEAILSRIAGRSFWVARSTSAAMQKDEQVESTRAAVKAWWHGVESKGEKEMLIEGVRSGGDDSAEQASRLAVLDPAASLDAIEAGIRATKSNWVRTLLIEAIARNKSEEATKALSREMEKCESLHGRVAAASELFARGNQDTVPEMINEWSRWKPSAASELEDENADSLIIFLGTCGDASGMKALANRFASLPSNVKFKIIEVATDTGVFHESVRDKAQPLSAEVEALGENLAVAALEDLTASFGMTMFNNVIFRNPRVCDIALDALAKHWPQRFQFKWTPTRFERDTQVVQARNIWRAANGLEALPLPERPSHELAARQPNVLSVLHWSGGEPLAGVPVVVGEPVTAESLIEMIALLHRKLPKGFAGFNFTAERAGDRRGFVIEIEWASRADSNPGGVWIAGGGWSFQTDITLEDESLYNAGGGSSFENRAQASGYQAEKRALAKAFAAGADKSITVSFSSRLTKD